jgi:hypothetical protein
MKQFATRVDANMQHAPMKQAPKHTTRTDATMQRGPMQYGVT